MGGAGSGRPSGGSSDVLRAETHLQLALGALSRGVPGEVWRTGLLILQPVRDVHRTRARGYDS